MKSRIILLSIPLLSVLVACENSNNIEKRKSTVSLPTGGSSNNTSESNTNSSDQMPSLPTGNSSTEIPTTTGGTAGASLLMGNWHIGGCLPSSDPAYKAITYDVVISASGFQKLMKYYSDAACATLRSSSEVIGTFVLKGASSAVPGAYEIDLSITSFKVDIGDEEGATLQNTRKMCGKTDWKVGDSHNCVQGGTVPEFDIAGLKDNKLYFGLMDATTDGRTVEKRPVALGATGLVKK